MLWLHDEVPTCLYIAAGYAVLITSLGLCSTLERRLCRANASCQSYITAPINVSMSDFCCFLYLLGDFALGYDLANANNVNMDYEAHVTRGGAVPDVILVRKSYEEKRKKTRARNSRAWKLKHLPIEAGEDR